MPKKHKLEILIPAQLELREIARTRRELAGAKSARKLTDGIYAGLAHLQTHPLMGIEAKDSLLKSLGYRILITGEHLCFYRFIDGVIFVYHIIHGATDYPHLFRELSYMVGSSE